MSLITLRNEALTVTISSLGAEMQSIRDARGRERLWQGDPAVWKGRAPILFPIAGGLKDDGYFLNGKRYDMPKHGYVRQL
ncbi:MAG: aldose 1-epimerase family protein, partial [Candidatus Limiplasma sp.]|nr:aldose 1-epimerase family protein [Candidatus Limiplasma sp.]